MKENNALFLWYKLGNEALFKKIGQNIIRSLRLRKRKIQQSLMKC